MQQSPIQASRFFIEHALQQRYNAIQDAQKHTLEQEQQLQQEYQQQGDAKNINVGVHHDMKDMHKSTEDSFLSLNSNTGMTDLLLHKQQEQQQQQQQQQHSIMFDSSNDKKLSISSNNAGHSSSASPQLSTSPQLATFPVSPELQNASHIEKETDNKRMAKSEADRTATSQLPSPSLLTFPSLVSDQTAHHLPTVMNNEVNNTKDDTNNTNNNNTVLTASAVKSPSMHNSISKTSYHVAVPSTVRDSQSINVPSQNELNNVNEKEHVTHFRLAYECSANLTMEMNSKHNKHNVVKSDVNGNMVMFGNINNNNTNAHVPDISNINDKHVNESSQEDSEDECKTTVIVKATDEIKKNDMFLYCNMFHESNKYEVKELNNVNEEKRSIFIEYYEFV